MIGSERFNQGGRSRDKFCGSGRHWNTSCAEHGTIPETQVAKPKYKPLPKGIFGLVMLVIDAHVHLYPEEVGRIENGVNQERRSTGAIV